ncbi:hypothetical protein ES703_69703 [subsurface metagenome]
MTIATRPPVLNQRTKDYPQLDTARSFAENLRIGAKDTLVKGEGWALYWLSSHLDILATLLRANIYAVVALPLGSRQKAEAGNFDQLADFRGWILEYDTELEKWILLAASEEIGRDEFRRLWCGLKGE